MFVKVIYNDQKPREETYECLSVQIIGFVEDQNKILMELERPGGEHTNVILDIDKSECEVYLMNDQGKTIDSFVWAKVGPVTVAVES